MTTKKGNNKNRIAKIDKSPYLFDPPPIKTFEPLVKLIRNPIWTEHKAKLIERYLYYFVLITRHGCYIDGFAGPQEPDKSDTWAAKLVLETEPKWLRHFHFFEIDKSKTKMLERLKLDHTDRSIKIYPGDFNINILMFLTSGSIEQKEATFCLLDQRTFECHWKSLEALASYKVAGYKIELFYFFANAWLDRALAAQKDEEVLTNWWGGNGWDCLRKLGAQCRVELVAKRFKDILGYKSAKPWPIYERTDGGGHIMYYMIHATDHRDAPLLMSRAYEKAVKPKESLAQLSFELGFKAR